MNNEFLYCKIQIEESGKLYWYIANYEASVGDYVVVPCGNTNYPKLGLVKETRLCSKDNAPYPPDKTKVIDEEFIYENDPVFYSEEKKLCAVTKNKYEIKKQLEKTILRDDKKKINMQKFMTAIETIPFVANKIEDLSYKLTVTRKVFKGPSFEIERAVTCMVFRGPFFEIEKLVKYVNYEVSECEYATSTLDDIDVFNCSGYSHVGFGIYEFSIFGLFRAFNFDDYKTNEKAKELIASFPNLKVAIFLENSQRGTFETLYSRSGYPYVTDSHLGIYYDRKSEDIWGESHSPTEDFSKTETFSSCGESWHNNYVFPYRTDWDSIDYVIEKDGILQQIVNFNYDASTEYAVAETGKGTGVIVQYLGNHENLILPKTVNNIRIIGIDIKAKRESKNFQKIKSLVVPEGYKFISGFSKCSSLEEVVLPKSLATICNRAFYSCKNHRKVDIKNKVRYINREAFANCPKLEEFYLPTNINSCGDLRTNIFKNSGIKKFFVESSTLYPSWLSNLLRGCKNYTIYTLSGSKFSLDGQVYCNADEYDDEYDDPFGKITNPICRDRIKAYYRNSKDLCNSFCCNYKNPILESILSTYNYKSDKIEDPTDFELFDVYISNYNGVQTLESFTLTLINTLLTFGAWDDRLENELKTRKDEIIKSFISIEGSSQESTLTAAEIETHTGGYEPFGDVLDGYDFELKNGHYSSSYRICDGGW